MADAVTLTPPTPDPELTWLMKESGMTTAELDQYKTVLGDAKFKSMLIKIKASNEQAASDRAVAEQERLNLEKKLTDEIYPEVRRVTQDSVRSQGELARAQAELKAAREYGIVPAAVEDKATEPLRAPGSPDPNAPKYLTAEDLNAVRAQAGDGLAVMNDLNAEHFKLFGSPVPNMSDLIKQVNRERTLGHADVDIRSVWEKSHNVAAKRAEIAAADQKKHDDGVRTEALREYKEKHGDNPDTRVGRESRFSTYDPSKGTGDKAKPWQRSAQRRMENEPWRQNAAAKIEKSKSALVH